VAVVSAAVFTTLHAAEQDWRVLPLISEGKIHPDWVHVGYGGMVVDDGALRTECDARGLGLLVYKKERAGNCQLRVVYKSKDTRSNAGVYVRMADGILDQVQNPGAAFDRDAAGKISPESLEKVKASGEREEGPWYAVHNGYEVQIADGGGPMHCTGSIYSLAPSKFKANNADAWRTMIITLTGNKIQVDLDGVRVSEFDSAAPNLPERKQWHEPKREPKRPEVGYIGLQNHDPGDVVWFKEVSVRPLPPGPDAKPAEKDLRPELKKAGVTPRQQGARGTCSVFTIAAALEYAFAKSNKPAGRLSVEYLNWASNQVVGHAVDGGFFSDLWKGWRAWGICRESELPYAKNFDAAQKPDDAVIAAGKELAAAANLRLHWIKRWNVRTGLTSQQMTSLKETLARGWPVCAGLRWPKNEEWSDGLLQMRPPQEVFDGHSILLTGYQEDATQPGGGAFTFYNTNHPDMNCRMTWEYAAAYMNDAAWIAPAGE